MQPEQIRRKILDHLGDAERLMDRARHASNDHAHALAAQAQVHVNAAAVYERFLR